ncbi:MAG: helix-turn-helix domain-containing protein [Erysipelotrichaceae bacterium]|nr:helix-turn-helix domain-containing protein [Erysipelotrichaceae bacterium]
MDLGKKIRQYRFKAGMTQEQLAEKLGIAAQSVSKWETAVTMPDITSLPLLAEIFGISIDDLFDLSTEQRLNRIENRMDAETELPRDVFSEYEEFLKKQLDSEQYKKRAVSLLAYLYWHRSNSFAEKAARYAKESIQKSPGEKDCQWILCKTENHAVWDWNMANHAKAVSFYQQIVEENPDITLPYLYLIDNLLADRRADEAGQYLARYSRLEKANPILKEIYKAHIALARFDEAGADQIVEKLLKEQPDNDVALFEAAQYYASKCSYEKAIECYESAFEKDPKRPRFQDALMAIAQISEITGNYEKAAETCDRMLELLEKEWGLSEETDSGVAETKKEKARLLAKASQSVKK